MSYNTATYDSYPSHSFPIYITGDYDPRTPEYNQEQFRDIIKRYNAKNLNHFYQNEKDERNNLPHPAGKRVDIERREREKKNK